MKKKVKRNLKIDLDTISVGILNEIGNSKNIKKLSDKANEFLVGFAFKLAYQEHPMKEIKNEGFTEKELKPYFERAMTMIGCEIFVRKGILRKAGDWFNPSYVETEMGKTLRKELK